MELSNQLFNEVQEYGITLVSEAKGSQRRGNEKELQLISLALDPR